MQHTPFNPTKSYDRTLSYTIPHPNSNSALHTVIAPHTTHPNDPSLTTDTTKATNLHPRIFDVFNDTELYLHENRKIKRLVVYDPLLYVTRLKHIYDGEFVGNPDTLVLSVAGATSPSAVSSSASSFASSQVPSLTFSSSSSQYSSARSAQEGEEKFRAATSIYFGPKSRYNTTGKVKEIGGKIEMQKISELAAAVEALEFVEMEMRMMVRGFEGLGTRGLRLVVVKTGSTNLWNGIVEHIYKWKRNDFHNTRGGKVAGEELWKRLDELMLQFETGGTRVAWWLVEKEENEAQEGAWLRATDSLL